MIRLQYGPYALCGWCIISDLALPELLTWRVPYFKELPLLLELDQSPADFYAAAFEVAKDGTVILRVFGIAIFRISPGADHVTIQPHANADPVLLRCHLYGSVLAVLCYMRGLIPLHGASVCIGSAAVIISGPSGAGKSTLAATLARRGHQLLSDDVCAIDLHDPSCPVLWPAFPQVKLLPDVIAYLHIDGAIHYSRTARGTKRHFGTANLTQKLGPTRPLVPIPAAAVYGLSGAGSDSVGRTLLTGKDALAFLDGQAHRAAMGRRLGLGSWLFQQLCRLAAAVPVYRLDGPRDLKCLDEIAGLIENGHKLLSTAVLSPFGFPGFNPRRSCESGHNLANE